jgi:NADH:ubiquinone oxidoreductase subunit 4 (subunit M)
VRPNPLKIKVLGAPKKIFAAAKISLYIWFSGVIMMMAFLCGLEKAPTFLVPIINPPFADNSPHLI